MATVEFCSDPAKWDSFVESAPLASNYHRWSWQQPIMQTFGHKPYYLAALDNTEITGILPLFFVKSWLFGRSLISVPFFSYGGVLAQTSDARDALLNRAAKLAAEIGASRIELRQGVPSDMNWEVTSPKVTMEVPLPGTSEELWTKLSTGMRNKVRNGRKQGFEVQWGGLEQMKNFYGVFAMNMRNLGTPVYPLSWFENLWQCRPDDIRIMSMWHGGRVVAAAFLNTFRDTVEIPWSASLPEFRKLYAPVFLYWTFLEWAIEHGYRRVDLGRCTRGSGTYEFKRHWPCEEKVLNWYHWRAPGTPPRELTPENSRFNLAVRVWKRLPLQVANTMGPRIVRSLP